MSTETVEVVNTDVTGDTESVAQATAETPVRAPRVKSTKTKADYNRAWYVKHGKEYAHNYYAKNRETILAARRAKTAANRAKRDAERAQQAAENPAPTETGAE